MVDGRILSAPTFQGVISDGQLQISGNFTEAEAVALGGAPSRRLGAMAKVGENGEDAPVAVVGLGQAELDQQMADVSFDGSVADHEAAERWRRC